MPSEKKVRAIRSILSSVTESLGIKKFAGTGRPNEKIVEREIFQHYGFTSRPLYGAEAILLLEDNKIYSLGEDDRRYRISTQNGEVCIYTDEGDRIHFKRGKLIHITSGNQLKEDILNNVEINTKYKDENISKDRKAVIGNNDTIEVTKNREVTANNIISEAETTIENKAPTITIRGTQLVNIVSDVTVIINSPTCILNCPSVMINGEIYVNGNITLSGSNTVQNENGDNLHQH